MKNYNLIKSFVAIGLIFVSCVPYNIAKYKVDDPIEKKLPNLELKIIENNLESFYYGPRSYKLCRSTDSFKELKLGGHIYIKDEFVMVRYSPDDKIPFKINPDKSMYGISSSSLIYKDYGGVVPIEIGYVEFNNPLKFDSISNPKEFLLYQEFFFGKQRWFQDTLFRKSQIIPMKDIYMNSWNVNDELYNEIIEEGCPVYAPNVHVKSTNFWNILEANDTVPKLISDFVSIYNYEFSNNILNNSDEKGYVVIKLLSGQNKINNYALPSILTLYSINLLGFPIFTQKKEIEIAVEIYTINDNLIATYYGKGNSKASSAVYYGYSLKYAAVSDSNGPLSRATNAEALRNALLDVKLQIEEDSELLIQRLLE